MGCTVVNGAASSATYTCTDNTNSRVSACAACDTTVKTVGKDDSTDDTCTASCATNEFANSDSVCTTCTAVADSAGTPTCTSATDSKVAACNTGFWKKTGAADSCMAVTKCDTSRPATADATATTDAVCQACADGSFGANSGTCTTCTAVTGALSGATYTCTSAADSRVSACAAATSVKKVGAAGASGGGGEPAGSTPAGSGVSAANTATVGFASVVLAVVAA